MITDEDASDELLEVLSLSRTPNCMIVNVMRVHSLRPNIMRGHVYLYRSAFLRRHQYRDYADRGHRGVLCLAHPRLSVIIYAKRWKNANKPMADLDRCRFLQIERHHPLVSVGGNLHGAKRLRGQSRLLSPKSKIPRLPANRF